MLRGFRWQLAALAAAIILLVLAISSRPEPTTSTQPADAPTATPQPVSSAPTVIPPSDEETPLVFREGLVGRVQRLNPLFARFNDVDRDITSLIFEGLVSTNNFGEYTPGLAESWTISSDGLAYVFHLRQDVLWQDGLPFSAADVATTVRLLQEAGDTLPESLTAFWRTVELELLDEYTVRFRLAQPLASFLDHARVGIVPAHVFNGIGVTQLASHPFNLSPIGTGPYQLERLIAGENGVASVNLRVAPVYRQRPEGQSGFGLERLTFKLYDSMQDAVDALAAGDLDALNGVQDFDLSPLEQDNIVQTHITTAPSVGVVLFNWENETIKAFRDQRTRRALTVGADRIGLVTRNMGDSAVPADSPIAPGSWAYDGPITWPSFDPDAARSLLSQIEFLVPTPEPTPEAEADADATETPTPTEPPPQIRSFVLLSDDRPEHTALAAELAAQWSQLGIAVRSETVSQAALADRLASGQFDAALVELTFEPYIDPDPYVFWHQGQYQVGQNFGGVNDRRTSELLERARRDANGLHRDEYYADFQRTFVNRSLALILYNPIYEYAVRSHIEGVQIGYLSTPSDRFRGIKDWRLSE